MTEKELCSVVDQQITVLASVRSLLTVIAGAIDGGASLTIGESLYPIQLTLDASIDELHQALAAYQSEHNIFDGCNEPYQLHIPSTLPEKWTGRLIGRMHNERITYDQLAAELGVTKSYVCMILNGKRKPPNIRARMEAAIDKIVESHELLKEDK